MTLLEVNDRGQGHIITNMTFVDLINCWRNYITNSWTKIVNNVNKIACVHGKLFLKKFCMVHNVEFFPISVCFECQLHNVLK